MPTIEQRLTQIERRLNIQINARDGAKWNTLEEGILNERLSDMIKDLSIEYGRSENAIVWKIYKLMKEAKQ